LCLPLFKVVNRESSTNGYSGISGSRWIWAGAGRFLLDRKSGELVINELNTLPGLTEVSVSKNVEASGLSFQKLLEELIGLAFERHKRSPDETSR
jgi:hypothetical protein